MQVGIVGTNSDLGNELSRFLSKKGIEAISIGRSHSIYCNSTYFFDIESPHTIDAVFDLDIDTLILLSWIQIPRNKKSMEKNLVAYDRIIQQAHLKGIRIVFISTLGTLSNNGSIHAHYKGLVEKLLSDNDQIIRPATIISEFGVMGKLSKRNQRSPIKIKTNILIPFVSIDKVIETVYNSLEIKSAKNVNVIDEITYLNLPLSGGNSKLYLFVPGWFINTLFNFVKFFRFSKVQELVDSWKVIWGLQYYLNRIRN
jgi:hypothetical protein